MRGGVLLKGDASHVTEMKKRRAAHCDSLNEAGKIFTALHGNIR
jgi:hypothetical protein